MVEAYEPCPLRGRTYTGNGEAVWAETWFQDAFGFKEGTYEQMRDKFIFFQGELMSTGNGERYDVGTFETPTLEELHAELATRQRRAAESAAMKAPPSGLTFENVVADVLALHEDQANANAVFQVSGNFDCLESYYGYRQRPGEHGITGYAALRYQGAACALACAPATVYRKYFWNGRGQHEGQELDCLGRLGTLVGNDKHGYWVMRNGYCYPKISGGIAKLSTLLANDRDLQERARNKVQVGVHWSTKVLNGEHSVCQVHCGALPVATEARVLVADWRPLAKVVLDAAYDATLATAAILAAKRGERVQVFLTAVGSGWKGNLCDWIADAIERALLRYREYPLDVVLVHKEESAAATPCFARLEIGREPHLDPLQPLIRKTDRSLTSYLSEQGVEQQPSQKEKTLMLDIFRNFDRNNDGVLDRSEFAAMLQKVDPIFFTPHVVDVLIADADAYGDGVVHYEEFVHWLIGEDEDIVGAICSQKSVAQPE
eukprot:TRINITY_DN45281_c0_g1_i1.p1 TRINITY_DN45281_c0_g1~~TRINITY_DN45281_c0_g1_i1.p1  ORF type:complete len:488 (+),score=109.91 TRINITY_DN45281_c0_g1_i1:97-1560(+)